MTLLETLIPILAISSIRRMSIRYNMIYEKKKINWEHLSTMYIRGFLHEFNSQKCDLA